MYTHRRFCRCILLPLLVALLFVNLAAAQTDRGTITGTVTDPSGAVLVGAKVNVVNTATGSSVETSTNIGSVHGSAAYSWCLSGDHRTEWL